MTGLRRATLKFCGRAALDARKGLLAEVVPLSDIFQVIRSRDVEVVVPLDAPVK